MNDIDNDGSPGLCGFCLYAATLMSLPGRDDQRSVFSRPVRPLCNFCEFLMGDIFAARAELGVSGRSLKLAISCRTSPLPSEQGWYSKCTVSFNGHVAIHRQFDKWANKGTLTIVLGLLYLLSRAQVPRRLIRWFTVHPWRVRRC